MARCAADGGERSHHCLVGVIFVAFAAESMLNHYSRLLFADWEERKKKRIPRKNRHETFFEAVSLAGYLGRTPYQTLNECLELRDDIAHGSTSDETVVIEVDGTVPQESLFSEILFAPLGLASRATSEKLREFIDALAKIQLDIEDNGYYPESRTPPGQQREKLCEQPLSVSGQRTW
jgi:hypothetical protein